MSRAFGTLIQEHDLLLVLLAAVICAFGSLTTMNVAGRAMGSRRVGLWLALVSVCAGCTVWATHFIAMLAYHQDVATTYDPALTVLSFLAGVVIMGTGFGVAIRGHRLRRARLLGGMVVGVGVIVLHYVGMAALRMPAELSYASDLVILSVVFSVGFGCACLNVAFGPDRPRPRLVGAGLMLVMIVSLHFTAMGAVAMNHDAGLLAVTGGVTRSVLATAVAIAATSVLLISMAGAVVDQKVSRRLAAEADRFRTLADGAFEGLVVHRNGVIVDANVAARRLLGMEDDASERLLTDWLNIVVDPEGPPSQAGGSTEVTIRRPDGSRFPAEICRRTIHLSGGETGELCAIRDLTSRKESEARIERLALHDALTDLPNRRFFMELGRKTMSRAERTGTAFAVLALDIDDFKRVNDTLGHAAGDELIRITARRIAGMLRDADVCARFGGDEFLILASLATEPSQAVSFAERLLEALQKPVELEYGEVAPSVSIGIALYPNDGATLEDILRNADTAMYRAKADGKATCRFFEPHMDAALLARRKLERHLRKAVNARAFTVAYQPIVAAHGRAPLGFEALVRWVDDELGDIGPTEFIPVAEETGLIIPIGEFVLRQACRDAASWPGSLRVAVNLSAVQFRRGGLVETVRDALAESGLPGDRLELEVTETLLMDNCDHVLRVLQSLKQLGLHISMDDFGTGYSALSYLQSFPFEKIKIDRVFVTDLATNPQNASIVRAVAAMGRSLSMRVVAEGVETDREADILLDLDCDEIQGFLISRPMPAAAVRAFLDDHVDATDAGKTPPLAVRSPERRAGREEEGMAAAGYPSSRPVRNRRSRDR